MNIKSITSNKPLLLVLIGAAVLLLALGAYLILQRQPSYNDIINNGINGGLNQSTDGNNDGFSSGDFAACMAGCEAYLSGESEVLSCRQTCEAADKFESNDVNACNSLEGILKDTCIIDKAVDQEKPEFCLMISAGTYRDTCYISVAEEMNDISICSNISQSIFKSSCEANFE